MSYLIARRSFHYSCFQSLIIRVPETKLGLFNYNEFAMYPPPKSTQPSPTQPSPTQPSPTQPSPTQPSLNQPSLIKSMPTTSQIIPSIPNLAIPVSYIRKFS